MAARFYPAAFLLLLCVTAARAADVPTVSFAAFDVTVSERDNVVRLAVGRTSTSGAVTLAWHADNLSPAAGAYFSPTAGTLTLPDGVISREIEISLVNDDIFTSYREFDVFLDSASAPFALGLRTKVNVAVIDDEPYARFTVVPESLVANEGDGVAYVRVARSGDLLKALELTYRIGNPYIISLQAVPAVGTILFGPGETEKSFPVHLIDDRRFYAGGGVDIELSLPSDGKGVFSNGSYVYTVYLRIIDNDPKIAVAFQDVAVAEGDAGKQTATLKITFSRPVPYASYFVVERSGGNATLGTDFELRSSYASFSEGDTETQITVDVKGDTQAEPDERISFRFYASWLGEQFDVQRGYGNVTILNDDPSLLPDQLQMTSGNSGTLLLDVGVAVSTATRIAVQSSHPEVTTVPTEVTIEAGQRRVEIPLTGRSVGSARIDATLPGRAPLSSFVTVSSGNATRIVLSPDPVTTETGSEVAMSVHLDPPSASTELVRLVAANAAIATVPQTVEIPAGGRAAFSLRALQRGETVVRATWPFRSDVPLTITVVTVGSVKTTAILTAITPVTGPVAGGTSVRATGARLTSDCTLKFGGAAATDVRVESDSVVSGVTPSHAAGTFDVILDCNGVTSILPSSFTFVASTPSLRVVSPSFGATTGGTHVRATGTNLYGGCWLFFGGVAARAVQSGDTESMTAVTPPGKAGASDVSVRCGADSFVLRNGFSYSPAADPSASIASVDPLIGSAGESVTITGSRFRPTDRITFNDVFAPILESSPDAHVVRIPDVPLGSASITLTETSARLTTTGPIFTILEAGPPHIGSVSPARAARGSELVLAGRGFRPPYTFSIGGAPAAVVEWGYTRVVVRVAAGAAIGMQRVEARNGAGALAAIGPAVDLVEHGVAVTAVTPGCGTTDGGTEITLHGTAFAPDTTVTFGDRDATSVTYVSSSEIRATVPAGVPGSSRITVVLPDRRTATLTNAFRYVSPLDPEASCAGATRRRSAGR